MVFGSQISFFLIIWAAIYQKPKENRSKYYDFSLNSESSLDRTKIFLGRKLDAPDLNKAFLVKILKNSEKLSKNPKLKIWSSCFNLHRKWGWFGTNFNFDARLRSCRVLHYTAIGCSFLILIWTSFSSFTVGTYFCITLLFMHKTSDFWVSNFAGDLGQQCFWANWKILMADFFIIILNNIIYRIYINLELFSELQTLKFPISFFFQYF